ncbi:MAG: hypothetical protein RR356_06595 [Bacteroidales bacterium]
MPLKKDYQHKCTERFAWISCVIAADREIEAVDYQGSYKLVDADRWFFYRGSGNR